MQTHIHTYCTCLPIVKCYDQLFPRPWTQPHGTNNAKSCRYRPIYVDACKMLVYFSLDLIFVCVRKKIFFPLNFITAACVIFSDVISYKWQGKQPLQSLCKSYLNPISLSLESEICFKWSNRSCKFDFRTLFEYQRV